MRVTFLILGALAAVGTTASEPPEWTLDEAGELMIRLARKPTPDETLVLRLQVAPLPENTKILVTTLDNEIAGGVFPFGVRPGSKARFYSIPVPAKAVGDNKVTLRLMIHQQDGKTLRPAARTEIKDALVVYSATTPRPPKEKP